jgi:hypothetical protein
MRRRGVNAGVAPNSNPAGSSLWRSGEALPFPGHPEPEKGAMSSTVALVTASGWSRSRRCCTRPSRPCPTKLHVAKLLVTMAVEGRGLAFLPQNLIGEELAQGALGYHHRDAPVLPPHVPLRQCGGLLGRRHRRGLNTPAHRVEGGAGLPAREPLALEAITR